MHTLAHINAKQFKEDASKVAEKFSYTLWIYEGMYYTELQDGSFYYKRDLFDEQWDEQDCR